MIFTPTPIAGAYLVDAEPRADERGAFTRIYCPEEFGTAGIDFTSTQLNIANCVHAFTLRGMHFNASPFEEAKFVRCVRGSVHDVAVDLRRHSPTYLKWVGVELSHANQRAVYLPGGCAHGFLTLEPDTDLMYQMSRHYMPGVDLGVRWNDPAFGIVWPQAPRVIHPRDAEYADYKG